MLTEQLRIFDRLREAKSLAEALSTLKVTLSDVLVATRWERQLRTGSHYWLGLFLHRARAAFRARAARCAGLSPFHRT